jgi:hypothetical protein
MEEGAEVVYESRVSNAGSGLLPKEPPAPLSQAWERAWG